MDFYNELLRQAEPAKKVVTVKNALGELVVESDHPEQKPRNKLSIMFNRTLRVPEDGKVYDCPNHMGQFPLVPVALFSDRLPLEQVRKGGLLLPLYQREAMFISFEKKDSLPLDFAIRVLAGGINVFTGLSYTNPSSICKDGDRCYIKASNQDRIDGFMTSDGLSKQFVAMPLGAGYTTEQKITGTEFIGGFQLQIARRLRQDVNFFTAYMGGLDDMKSPADLGLKCGDNFCIQFKGLDGGVDRHLWPWSFWETADHRDFRGYHKSRSRPLFVHELGADNISPQILVLSANPNINITLEIIRIRQGLRLPNFTCTIPVPAFHPKPDNFIHQELAKQDSRLSREIPHFKNFKGMDWDFHGTLADMKLKNYTTLQVYFGVSPPICTSPRVCAIQFLLDPHSITPTVLSRNFLKLESSWEVGIAAGGIIAGKNHHACLDCALWNWQDAAFVEIQLLNTVAFKDITGLSAPHCPISFQEYVDKGLPLPSATLDLRSQYMPHFDVPDIKSVGETDLMHNISVNAYLKSDGLPVICIFCEKMLSDTMFVTSLSPSSLQLDLE